MSSGTRGSGRRARRSASIGATAASAVASTATTAAADTGVTPASSTTPVVIAPKPAAPVIATNHGRRSATETAARTPYTVTAAKPAASGPADSENSGCGGSTDIPASSATPTPPRPGRARFGVAVRAAERAATEQQHQGQQPGPDRGQHAAGRRRLHQQAAGEQQDDRGHQPGPPRDRRTPAAGRVGGAGDRVDDVVEQQRTPRALPRGQVEDFAVADLGRRDAQAERQRRPAEPGEHPARVVGRGLPGGPGEPHQLRHQLGERRLLRQGDVDPGPRRHHGDPAGRARDCGGHQTFLAAEMTGANFAFDASASF